MTTLFFVAGERSGDTHGAGLVRAMRRQAPEVHCEGLGGSLMEAAGMTLRHDLAGQGIMGFTEVLKHILPIRRLFYETLDHLRKTRPACLVLIDYPGFNIRLAKAVDGLGIPVVYYISPQVWAWKKKRIHTLARYVRKMLVIFPFEEALYREVGLDTVYVGHPLLDYIESYTPTPLPRDGKLIGLLPGSREQEVRRLLPVMLATAKRLQTQDPALHFITPCVSEARAAQVRAIAGDFPLEVRVDAMYDVLSQSHFCLVASGTATLETLMFGTPMLIMYKVSPLSYLLARLLVDIRYIGIVNILAKKEIIPEFIQHKAAPERVAPVAWGLIQDSPARRKMLQELAAQREKLGAGGASDRAATEILTLIQGTAHG